MEQSGLWGIDNAQIRADAEALKLGAVHLSMRAIWMKFWIRKGNISEKVSNIEKQTREGSQAEKETEEYEVCQFLELNLEFFLSWLSS